MSETYFPERPREMPARTKYVANVMNGMYKSGAFMSLIGGL